MQISVDVGDRGVTLPHSDRISVLITVFALGMGYYLAQQPQQPWALLLLTALAALGVDGVIRSHPAGRFDDPTRTATYLIVPVLFTLAAGLMLRDVVSGYWSLLAAAAAAVLFGAIVYAEVLTITPRHTVFPSARLLLGIVTYVTGFGLFATIYSFGLDLVPAAILTGLVAALLSVEIMREVEADPQETLVHGAAIGIVLGESRWALHFLSLDGYLAALGLLLAAYVVCELMHAHLAGHLTWLRGLEYGGVGAAGVAVVVAAKIVGSA